MGNAVLIVGAGLGLSATLARLCARDGMTVALATRNIDKLETIAAETRASLHQCDASDADEVARLFADLDDTIESPEWVAYNPSARLPGPIQDLDPEITKQALNTTCYGAFLVAQQAAKRIQKQSNGSILFTGTSAGVKSFANSSVFAMGKFGLRGLAQSLARELHPQKIHIGHFVIDGGIRSKRRAERQDDGVTECLIPQQSLKAICNFTASTAVPGHGKSNCALGWNAFSNQSDHTF